MLPRHQAADIACDRIAGRAIHRRENLSPGETRPRGGLIIALKKLVRLTFAALSTSRNPSMMVILKKA